MKQVLVPEDCCAEMVAAVDEMLVYFAANGMGRGLERLQAAVETMRSRLEDRLEPAENRAPERSN